MSKPLNNLEFVVEKFLRTLIPQNQRNRQRTKAIGAPRARDGKAGSKKYGERNKNGGKMRGRRIGSEKEGSAKIIH